MGKNAWLIVSDLHLYYKNLSSRIDYVAEMQRVRSKIVRIGERYRSAGWSVGLLLLGDVFHRSYNNTFLSNYDNNFFVMWRQQFGPCFSVVGNHELHYYASNPFFTLVKTIESEKVRQIVKDVWTPRGLLPTIKVIDRLEDGDVVFHFNHYGTPVSKPETGKINVGLFHQDVYNDMILRDAERKAGRVWGADKPVSLDVVSGYQYCFFGHMHKLYGVYRNEEGGLLYYLASLGRTNSSEVNDECLERCVPVVLVENGSLVSVKEEKFELESRAECVKEEVVQEAKEQYVLQKLRAEARSYAPLDDNPIDGLKQFFIDNPLALAVVNGLLCNPIDEIGTSIKQRFESIGGR